MGNRPRKSLNIAIENKEMKINVLTLLIFGFIFRTTRCTLYVGFTRRTK